MISLFLSLGTPLVTEHNMDIYLQGTKNSKAMPEFWGTQSACLLKELSTGTRKREKAQLKVPLQQ